MSCLSSKGEYGVSMPSISGSKREGGVRDGRCTLLAGQHYWFSLFTLKVTTESHHPTLSLLRSTCNRNINVKISTRLQLVSRVQCIGNSSSGKDYINTVSKSDYPSHLLFISTAHPKSSTFSLPKSSLATLSPPRRCA